jgi:AcrR family transcriptional regulator
MVRRATTAAQTRDRIVEATLALHRERGIAATSMKDIAQRADVSIGTVYHHFPRYEDAIRACGARTAQRTRLPTLAIFDGIGTVPGRIEALVQELFAFYDRHPTLPRARCDQDRFPVLREFTTARQERIEALARAALAPAGPSEQPGQAVGRGGQRADQRWPVERRPEDGGRLAERRPGEECGPAERRPRDTGRPAEDRPAADLRLRGAGRAEDRPAERRRRDTGRPAEDRPAADLRLRGAGRAEDRPAADLRLRGAEPAEGRRATGRAEQDRQAAVIVAMTDFAVHRNLLDAGLSTEAAASQVAAVLIAWLRSAGGRPAAGVTGRESTDAH